MMTQPGISGDDRLKCSPLWLCFLHQSNETIFLDRKRVSVACAAMSVMYDKLDVVVSWYPQVVLINYLGILRLS